MVGITRSKVILVFFWIGTLKKGKLRFKLFFSGLIICYTKGVISLLHKKKLNYFTSSYPHHYERFMASAATNSRSSRSRGLVVEDVVVIVVVAVVDPVDV